MSIYFFGYMQLHPGVSPQKMSINKAMKHATLLTLTLRTWKDTRAQDLIEYALMAGFVAVAAGAIMPNVATSISTIFSLVGSVLSAAANQGS